MLETLFIHILAMAHQGLETPTPSPPPPSMHHECGAHKEELKSLMALIDTEMCYKVARKIEEKRQKGLLYGHAVMMQLTTATKLLGK